MSPPFWMLLELIPGGAVATMNDDCGPFASATGTDYLHAADQARVKAEDLLERAIGPEEIETRILGGEGS